jgi:RNA polymerase sigma factor (sigma-70 family)
METAWRAWDSLRDAERRQAWLRQICVRECLRSRRRLAFWTTAEADREVAAEPLTSDTDIDLDAAYTRLSRQQRAVITLHYQYGYGLDECAGLMGCRAGTARSHLARALASMRKELSYD